MIISFLQSVLGAVPVGFEEFEYLFGGVVLILMISAVAGLFYKTRDVFSNMVRGRSR